jgi:hypothetical protein
VASWMTPRRAPLGFWAGNSNGERGNTTNKKRAALKEPRRFVIKCLLIARVRLRNTGVYYHRS